MRPSSLSPELRRELPRLRLLRQPCRELRRVGSRQRPRCSQSEGSSRQGSRCGLLRCRTPASNCERSELATLVWRRRLDCPPACVGECARPHWHLVRIEENQLQAEGRGPNAVSSPVGPPAAHSARPEELPLLVLHRDFSELASRARKHMAAPTTRLEGAPTACICLPRQFRRRLDHDGVSHTPRCERKGFHAVVGSRVCGAATQERRCDQRGDFHYPVHLILNPTSSFTGFSFRGRNEEYW